MKDEVIEDLLFIRSNNNFNKYITNLSSWCSLDSFKKAFSDSCIFSFLYYIVVLVTRSFLLTAAAGHTN